ncbi:MAG: phosphatidate cytidylyltransferase, partial [Gammaproteobacteria bacterium]|nr:phosphatidate cytidylyltransferase [Gammaproteobacteria bacterium]
MNGVVRQRIATAIALALPLIAIISWSPGWLTAAVFAAFVAIAADEWARLCGVHGPFMRAAYIGLTTGLVAVAYVSRDDSHQVAMVLAAAGIWWLLAAMLLAVVQMREAPLVVPRSVQLVLGLLVLVPAWLALVVLHGLSAWLLLATLVIVWTADIAAFFAGRA